MTSSETIESAGIGQPAPDFKLPEVRRGTVSLSDTVKEKKAVIVFYRGGWCPIFNRRLSTLSQD